MADSFLLDARESQDRQTRDRLHEPIMSLWNISRNVSHLLATNRGEEIIEILRSYSPEQRRFIVAIQHQKSSLLFHAVKRALDSVVKYFLENCEADPNSFGFIRKEKFTCLAVAILINSPDLVNTLLYYHADTEIVFSSNQITALFYACKFPRVEIVQLLLEKGADPNTRNHTGETLINCTYNLNALTLLVLAGADLNLTERFGVTCLVLAIQNGRIDLVNFLLNLEDTQVRLIGDSGTDALYHILDNSEFDFPQDVIEKVIEKGSYTTEEIAMVHEMHSCKYHVTDFQRKARESWQKALELQGKPMETPMFATLHKALTLNEVIKLFNANDIPPLLFLDSMSGFSSYTAHIYTLAALNVLNDEKYISLCEFFFNKLKSMEDMQFFRMLVHSCEIVTSFFRRDNIQKLHTLTILDVFTNYIEEVKTRLQKMTPKQRSVHGFKIDYLVLTIIHCFSDIRLKLLENINWLHNTIKRLIKLDLRGPCQKSLLQKCADLHRFLIKRFFLSNRADINNSDRLGKTILHDLIESSAVSPKTISLIIYHGFDFKAVKYDEYCLPCRLKEMGLLPTPMKYTSLQCLAVKAFCENEMTSFNEVPRHLMSIVKSHLHEVNCCHPA